MSSPRVSVVIPSSRPVRLAFALEALAGQSVGLEAFEVVVARDSRSAGPTPPPERGLRVTYLENGAAANIAALRNLGWRAATAPLIAFADDDCRAAPDWLERLLAADSGTDAVLQGRTETDPDERHLLHGLARSQEIRGPSAWSQTCNIAYPRELLDRLGGFDERYPAIGEDTDLGLRARAAGAEFRYVAGAVVWHAVIPRTLRRALRESWSRDTVPLLISRYPELRGAICLRYFWKRSHAALLLAVAGLIASRRARPAILATLPYLTMTVHVGEAGTPRRLARELLGVPARVLVDGAEVAATLRGAFRHRAFVA